MFIDLIRLKNNLDEFVDINEIIRIDKSYFINTDIIDLSQIKVSGSLYKDSIDSYVLDINISGTMTLPCSVTLKPVLYPFDINISGNLEQLLEEIGKNIKKSENTIDILPIIWENILMEIPIKVTSDDLTSFVKEGEGWKLVTEDNIKINSELEKLKDLL